RGDDEAGPLLRVPRVERIVDVGDELGVGADVVFDGALDDQRVVPLGPLPPPLGYAVGDLLGPGQERRLAGVELAPGGIGVLVDDLGLLLDRLGVGAIGDDA